MAQILANSIDVINVGAHGKPNQLNEIRQQKGANWGSGGSNFTLVRVLKLNVREGAPWAQDFRFRQAMAYSMDRLALIEAAGGTADSVTSYPVAPEDPAFNLAERAGVNKYPYDPTRAQQLFAQAGWTKGTDGLLKNGAGQQIPPFNCCRYADTGSENIRESLIWGDALKQAGVDAQHPIPALPAGLAGTELRKAGNFGWGGQITNWNLTAASHFLSITSGQMPSDANRWTGQNNGGYSSSAYDTLVAERMATIPVVERLQKEVQLLRTIADELPVIVNYYNPSIIFAREGVTGVSREIYMNTAIHVDIYKWDIK